MAEATSSLNGRGHLFNTCKNRQGMSISVIIPSYNRAAFLGKAMRSVAAQSLKCDELIIIDDGSTDNTPEVVKAFANQAPFPVYYNYQENKGASAARNKGIRKASSDFICFLDSDDRFELYKLERQYKEMIAKESLISHTKEIWFRRGKLLNQKKKHQPRQGYIFPECLNMCVVGMSTVMARKKLFNMYGHFDECLPCCEDYDYWLRVSVYEKFHLVDSPLTIKEGGRSDQLSVIYRMGMDKYRIQSIENLLERSKLNDDQYRMALNELVRKCTIYGKGCIKHGREEEGRHYLRIPAKYRI